MISSAYMNGQKVIDLSETNVLSKSESIKKGKKKIILKYLIQNPDYYYTIDSNIETTIYEPLDYQLSLQPLKESDSTEITKEIINNDCDEMNEKYQDLGIKYTAYVNSLSKVKSEVHLKDSINNNELSSLIDSIKKFDFGNCSIKKMEVKNIEEISKIFQHEINFEGLEKGQKITINIKKFKTENDKPLQTWKRTYVTPKRGKWITSFGVGSSYIPASRQQTYRTEKANDSTYTLAADGRREALAL